MRQLFFYTAPVLLSLLLAAPGGADTDLEIEELRVRLVAPAGLEVLKRDVPEESFSAALYPDYTADTLRTFFKENSIYLDCMPEDRAFDIQLTMAENEKTEEVFDLGLYDSATLDQIEQMLRETYRQTRYKTEDIQRVQTDTALFFRLDMAGRLGTKFSCRQYYTVFNGQEIRLTLYCPDKKISEEAYASLEAIFASMTFTEVLTPEKEYSAGPLIPESYGDVMVESLKNMALPAMMAAAFFATLAIYGYLVRKGKIRERERS